MTEKILDCMASHTIPVYYGCSNIADLVPADCFIDYRAFGSLEELDARLQSMSDEEYIGYTERMRNFIENYNAPYRHSAFRLYETITSAVEHHKQNEAKSFPSDYLMESTLAGKLRFFAMKLLLPHHRMVYAMFSIARWFGR